MSGIKRLIILDLNGLLIHRLFKDEYARSKHVLQQQYRFDLLTTPKQHGNFAVWFRPNIQEFLSWLMDNFHVAIWSSVLQRNIIPIVDALLPDQKDKNRLLFWWDQDKCGVEEDPEAVDPKKAKSFFKRLNTVWDDEEVNSRWSADQPADARLRDHTLLIDDNPLKVRDNPPHTAIHPRAWKQFEVYAEYQAVRIFKDNSLEEDGSLRQWLQSLLNSNDTVPEYVKNHPYVEPLLEEVEQKSQCSWESDWN